MTRSTTSALAGCGAPLRVLLGLSLLTGIAYPLLVTAFAQLVCGEQATGSVIRRDGVPIGSRLIGQEFRAPGWFWSRPSATGGGPYVPLDLARGTGSSGSNLGPNSPDLRALVAQRVAALLAAERALGIEDGGPIPVDLVTASASGLDPQLSVAGALRQVRRVAAARGLPVDDVRALVHAHVEAPQLGLLGEPVVNVLILNLALDGAVRGRSSGPR